MTELPVDALPSVGADPEDARWQRAVGAELDGERARNRISTKDLAALVGVDPVSVRRYLAGERLARPRVMAAMCQAFGVRVSDIWARAEERLER